MNIIRSSIASIYFSCIWNLTAKGPSNLTMRPKLMPKPRPFPIAFISVAFQLWEAEWADGGCKGKCWRYALFLFTSILNVVDKCSNHVWWSTVCTVWDKSNFVNIDPFLPLPTIKSPRIIILDLGLAPKWVRDQTVCIVVQRSFLFRTRRAGSNEYGVSISRST